MPVAEPMFAKSSFYVKTFFSKEGFFFSIWFYRCLRILLAAAFIWSGISKLSNPIIFATLIDSYGLIPETWTSPISYGLPVLEVLAGTGLLIDIKGNLAVIAILLIGFMFILGYGIHMGLDVDCGCFGPNDPEKEAYHGLRSAFFRDVILLGVIVYLYFWRHQHCYSVMGFNKFMNILKRR